MRQSSFFTRLFLYLIQAPLYLWLGAKLMLDAVGRAAVLADLADEKSTSGRILLWVLSTIIATPWYIPTGLAVVVTATWLFFMFKLHGPIRSASSTQPNKVLQDILDESEEGKPVSNQPITYFSGLLSKENTIQATALLMPYIGSLIRFRMAIQINNITESQNAYFSVGGTLEDGNMVVCRLPLKYRNYLARLTSGESIDLTGTIAAPFGKIFIINGCHPSKPMDHR